MGKKKFIDKKKAATFAVVHRSQHDPLLADDTASSLVLVPVELPGTSRGKKASQGRTAFVKGNEDYFDNVSEVSYDHDDDDDDDLEEGEDDEDFSGLESDEEDEEEQPQKPSGQSSAAAAAATAAAKKGRTRRVVNKNPGEAAKYGIMFDDTQYDYTQHLKEIGNDPNGVFIPSASVAAPKQKNKETLEFRAGQGTVALPKEVFASEYENETGLLHLDLPSRGPQLELGADVLEVLEALEDEAYEGELDDDFLAKLDGSDIEGDAGEDEGEDDSEWSHVRKANRQRQQQIDGESDDEDEDEDDGSEDSYGERPVGPNEIKDRNKSSRLTQYSMTSSILPRSENLQILDNRFERLMAQYDSTEIGELDGDDPSTQGLGRIEAVEDVLDEFLKTEGTKAGLMGLVDSSERQLIKQGLIKATPAALERIQRDQERARRITEEDERQNTSFHEKTRVHTEEALEANWDAETILSTYSNLENHPSMIRESRRPRIQVNRRGFPSAIPAAVPATTSNSLAAAAINKSADAVPPSTSIDDHVVGVEEDEDESDTETVTTAVTTSTLAPHAKRSKSETPEEKRARKQAVKEHRRNRRSEKKQTTQLFEAERVKQERERVYERESAVLHL